MVTAYLVAALMFFVWSNIAIYSDDYTRPYDEEELLACLLFTSFTSIFWPISLALMTYIKFKA